MPVNSVLITPSGDSCSDRVNPSWQIGGYIAVSGCKPGVGATSIIFAYCNLLGSGARFLELAPEYCHRERFVTIRRSVFIGVKVNDAATAYARI